jgi:formylglycine-generating enzyme required for sulfatase activity
MSTTENKEAELSALLVDIFDGDAAGLRRWVRLSLGKEIHDELPTDAGSLSRLAFETTLAIQRHGLADPALFESLCALRPRSVARIQDVARMHGVARPAGAGARAGAAAPDPLAQKIEHALRRKQRLEAAGLPTEDVLAEIRELKREHRRGGQLRPGDVLGGRYLLVEQIGRGGFATVWKARDGACDEHVAIKVLHPELASDIVRRKRFFRGARVMAELALPAVVQIREREAEDDGFFYFVMDFIPGGNLQDAVLAGRMRPEQVMSIILSVSEALIQAHARGHLHRDIKPANVLLTESGEPRLTDFDLVTGLDTTGGTRTGPLGTFIYAAPEMMEHPQVADARADVYGLGMTMAFVLHGDRLPRKALTARERFIEDLGCAPALAAVLKQATAEDPAVRHPGVAAFCEALRAATSSEVSASATIRAMPASEPAGDSVASERAGGGISVSSVLRALSAEDDAHTTMRDYFLEPVTGIGFLWVPGGTFLMGADDITDNERPPHRVQVSPFWLAETPVTNRQYEVFLQTHREHTVPRYWGDQRYNEPEQPVVGVSWLEAKAFCRWLTEVSGREIDLPTEAQWEFAARGEESRSYPWGADEPDERRAYHGKNWANHAPLPVGSLPVGRGPWGHLDLAGNVWEWCRDAWNDRAYGNRGDLTLDPHEADAPGGRPGVPRACRGGAFASELRCLRAAFRYWVLDLGRNHILGFRVAAFPANR